MQTQHLVPGGGTGKSDPWVRRKGPPAPLPAPQDHCVRLQKLQKFSLQWLMRTLSGNMVFSGIPISKPFFLNRGGHDAGGMWWEFFLLAVDHGTLVCGFGSTLEQGKILPPTG